MSYLPSLFLFLLQMDADYDPVADMERKKKKREKKKKNKLAQALNTKKPVFDPSKSVAVSFKIIMLT